MPFGLLDDVMVAGPAVTSTPWQESQYELGGVRFGGYSSDLIVSKADHGAADVRTQDNPNPVGDGDLFGRDTLSGPTWAFDLVTNTKDHAAALAVAEDFARVWRSGRDKPGAVVPLRYFTAGRLRRVYGRPRRYAGPAPDLATRQGRAKITADFKCANDLHYEDDQRSSPVLTLLTNTSGGFVLPGVLPIETLSGGERQGVIDDVGGEAPTPFEVTIKGPIRAPWAAGPGWRLELPNVVLAYDQSVTAATYPWALTVKRNDGTNLAGGLSVRSRLANAVMRPGPGEFTFGGVDPTNTATCTIRWRPAYYSL